MRHVILHHHLFKNAGTTLDSILERTFGPGFATLHDEHGSVAGRSVAAFLGSHPDVRAISSHHTQGELYAQIAEQAEVRFLHMTLIRDPLDRLLSTYKFYRRNSMGGAVGDAARTLPYQGYVDFLIAAHPHLIDNPQVNHIANAGFYCRAVSQTDLALAQAKLAGFALSTPVEAFDRAMVALEYYLAPTYPSLRLDFSYIRQNVSEPHGAADERFSLHPATIAFMRPFLMYDLALRDHVAAELERRILPIADFPGRLAAFRQRCDARVAEVAATAGA